MLSQQEKVGCQALLKRVPTKILIQLAQTVTKGQICVQTREEATKAVVVYTESPAELLKRRKMKREFLFDYLAAEGVIVSVQSEKHILSQKIMEVWGSVPVKVTDLMEQTGEREVTEEVTTPAVGNDEMEMARQFVTWFFQMLNSYHPGSIGPPVTQFGPEHFYNDCNMKLLCAAPHLIEDEYSGADIVCQRLLAFVKEEQLKFNPNTDESGLLGRGEPHGLKLIMVCGTVHQNGTMVGIFEQQFGLARDPDMEQNWRIKFTNLKMKSSHMGQMPTLKSTAQLLAIQS